MTHLELKHLAPYLPYNLQWMQGEEIFLFTGSHIGSSWDDRTFSLVKPILRPLSDLTKEITVNEEMFIPREIILSKLNHLLTPSIMNNIKEVVTHLDYTVVQKLFEWHFDVFGLIESGLAIDVNTLEVNPYERITK